MKKIFVLTGEPSGDKLASRVVAHLKNSRSDIEYLSVGGEHLKALGIKSLYDLKEVTYLGFTKVLLNIFKIKGKINETVKEIIKFKPDILFSVDSPDFTLRVAKEVKKKDPNIKAIHFVAPQVWVWREKRVKKFKKFLDHILLLFKFEKKYIEELERFTEKDEVFFERLLNLVQREIQNLPPKCRKIFLMSKQEGFTNVEIAEQLNVSIKTIEYHITKAFAILRQKANKDMEPVLFLLFGFRRPSKLKA